MLPNLDLGVPPVAKPQGEDGFTVDDDLKVAGAADPPLLLNVPGEGVS